MTWLISGCVLSLLLDVDVSMQVESTVLDEMCITMKSEEVYYNNHDENSLHLLAVE